MRITHSFQRLVEAITQSSLIATLHYFSTFYTKKYVLSRAKYTYILCIYSLFYEQSKKRRKLSFSLRRFRSIAVKRHSHTHTRHKRVHYRKANNKAPSRQQNSAKRICFRLSSVQYFFLKLLPRKSDLCLSLQRMQSFCLIRFEFSSLEYRQHRAFSY